MTAELLSTGLSLIGLQLVSRLLTFILNQALVRLASPEALGTASIQFEVLINTVLFFSREGVRGALSRTQSEFSQSSSTSDLSDEQAVQRARRQKIINTCFLPIPVGLIFSFLLFFAYWFTTDPTTANQPHFRIALLLYLLAVLCELISEPPFIHLILTGQTRRRVKIEGIGVTLRTITTVFVVGFGYRNHHDWGLLGFAAGQLAYGLALAIGFWTSHFRSQSNDPHHVMLTLNSLHPDPSKPKSKKLGSLESWFAKSELNLCYALTRQSIVKQFLTEGDKMIISKICPIAHQGGYALAMNYGSLVARILFQPIEETSRLYFSKSLSDQQELGQNSSRKHAGLAATDLLTNLLRCHIYLGLVFVTFGPPFVHLGLLLLLGPRSAYLTDGAQSIVVKVLQAFCNLLPLFGLNGILEAFVQSAANESDLNQMTKLMVAWCAVFIGSVTLFSTSRVSQILGITAEVGMVMATGVNMFCRILYGWTFSAKYAQRQSPDQMISLSRASPSSITMFAFAIATIITRWSEYIYSAHLAEPNNVGRFVFKPMLNHLVCGITSLLGCILVMSGGGFIAYFSLFTWAELRLSVLGYKKSSQRLEREKLNKNLKGYSQQNWQ